MLVFTSNIVIPARNVIIVAASANVPFISIVLVVLTFDVLLLLISWPSSILLLFIIGTVVLLLLLSIRTNLAIISQSSIAAGRIARNVACQPKFWIMAAPPTRPTTAPPENVEVNIVWPIASFLSGRASLMIPKAIGNIAIPTPCNTLATSMNSMLVANRPAIIPAA